MFIYRSKKNKMIYCRLLVLLFGFVVSNSKAQSLKPDTAFLASAEKKQTVLYHQFIQGQSRLYNGSEYRDYLSKNEEHPYFGVDDWSYGDIRYDDEWYEDVPMFYDLSRDKVISEHILNGAKLELVSEKISAFILGDHKFVRLRKDEGKVISDGFYEMLHDGKTKVYVRREKILQQRIESTDIIATFDEKNKVYILKDGKYYPVKNKKSVLAVFDNKKPELKSFLGKNNIHYKDNREKAISRLAEFYDTLTN